MKNLREKLIKRLTKGFPALVTTGKGLRSEKVLMINSTEIKRIVEEEINSFAEDLDKAFDKAMEEPSDEMDKLDNLMKLLETTIKELKANP